MPRFYLTPKQDDFNKIPELQVCIVEALYDVDSIVADPGRVHIDEGSYPPFVLSACCFCSSRLVLTRMFRTTMEERAMSQSRP